MKKQLALITIAFIVLFMFSIITPKSTVRADYADVPSHSSSYKPLDWSSIIMLIGDLENDDNIVKELHARIDTASASGVDTVMIVFSTHLVESSFEKLDSLIEYAAGRGIAVIPRIIVDSSTYSEYIHSYDDILPDYTNKTQLNYGKSLLANVTLHLENFANIVAYQIEWGHYGESWANSPFWNTLSSNSTFIDYLRSISSTFASITTENFANWVTGDIMYYSQYLPENSDPRRYPINVALFYWYQQWRNSITLNITWAFRSVAKNLTDKPIIGFSYNAPWAIPYVYSADRYLDAAFCDMAPDPNDERFNFTRDAYFKGLHLGELDFDSPYFYLNMSEKAIKWTYSKGIIPVIFYPLWSKNLNDSDIPTLVNYMKQYSVLSRNPIKSVILLVMGRNDVGFNSFTSDQPLGSVLISFWLNPPGLIKTLENQGLMFDVISPEVYSPDIGGAYKLVIALVPRDTVDQAFLELLSETTSSVLIMHPSFIVGTPTMDRPTDTTSAIHGEWNTLNVKGNAIRVQVNTGPLNTSFAGKFSYLDGMNNYQANPLFSYFHGAADAVYAVLQSSGYQVAAKIRNIVLFGFDLRVSDQTQRKNVSAFFETLLRMMNTAAYWVTKVPRDYATIQGAIDAAFPRTTIQVSSGVYKERLHIDEEGLTLVGAGTDTTIIDGSGSVGGKYSVVEVSEANNTIISGFTIQNSWEGISLDSSSGNSISGNNIANNDWGIALYLSSSNRMYHNKFINNTSQAVGDQSINVWDVGYPSGGNYWSDYTGVDLNHDGIGDTPYVIDGHNRDDYPLMGMSSDFNATSEYQVQTVCNSTITAFQFNGAAIVFKVAGEPGTTGFCRICIPTALMNSPYDVLVDGVEVPFTLLPCSNAAQNFLYFNYAHSTHEITIRTHAVPPSLLLPLIAVAVVALVLAVVVAVARSSSRIARRKQTLEVPYREISSISVSNWVNSCLIWD